MPVPTGDLEAAFQATGATNVVAYSALVELPDTAESPAAQTYRSFGWARAVGIDGMYSEAWLETGESYHYTAMVAVRSVEETLDRTLGGAFSPVAAFGPEFAFSVAGTSKVTASAPQLATGR
jgi:hypothetical protein